MSKKITLLIKIGILYLLMCGIIYSAEKSIIPLKKPILSEDVKKDKLSKNIIRPLKKPISNNNKLIDDSIKPITKPKIVEKKQEKIEDKTEDKVKEKLITQNKIKLIIPKSKPLVVKKEIDKSKKKSKYFTQKDFSLAKRAIKEMEKRQWKTAISLSKKSEK